MTPQQRTIAVTFDPTDLPAWAQAAPAVVWLCKRDLAFRCDVARATTDDYRRSLILQARRQHDAWRNS